MDFVSNLFDRISLDLSFCSRPEFHIPGNNILVLPADLVGKTADSAVLASGLESEDTEGLGDNHALDLVVWGWDTLEDLKPLHGGSTTGSLVWDHTTDGLVEDAGWGAEVEGTTTGWVVTSHLAEVGVVLYYKHRCVSIPFL